jgi:multiple sugar transport system substrate-binding protein
MYDHLYARLRDRDVEVVVHDDHPTLNRRVAELLAAGERIDVLATHSKYAPSQRQWLQPLDDLLATEAVAPLAPRAVELCRFEGGLLCAPRLVDVRVLWVRTDRVATIPDTWTELLTGDVTFGFPGRESGLFGTFFELVVGAGGALFDDARQPTMATAEAEWAVDTLCRLAARAPADLPDWHYDGVDAALIEGRVDAAAAWPGGWGAIRDSASAADLEPCLYPAGPTRRVSYSGCHAWGIPTTCGDRDGAIALVTELLGRDAQALDAAGGNMCAHVDALAAVEPENATDRRRLEITRATIDTAMITYPPLVRFPEIEDAGWSAIRDAITGRCTARDATVAIQDAARSVLA